jgi:hypothetical protein
MRETRQCLAGAGHAGASPAWPGTHPPGRLIEPRRGLTESFGDHTRKQPRRFFSPLRAVFTASVEIISLQSKAISHSAATSVSCQRLKLL